MSEWDEAKNATNLAKHGIEFNLAKRIFDAPVLTMPDSRRDYGEVRQISLGNRGPWRRAGRRAYQAGRRYQDHLRALAPSGERRRYEQALSELRRMADYEIDFSDNPEMTSRDWANARVVEPGRAEAITLEVKRSVLDAFKAEGENYEARMTGVLEDYVRSHGRL